MHRPTGLPWELPGKTSPIAKHPPFSTPLPCPPRLLEIFHPIPHPARRLALVNHLAPPVPRPPVDSRCPTLWGTMRTGHGTVLAFHLGVPGPLSPWEDGGSTACT